MRCRKKMRVKPKTIMESADKYSIGTWKMILHCWLCRGSIHIAHRLECNMARSAHPEINYPFSFSQKQFPIVARTSTGQGCTHTLIHTHDFSMHMFWKEEEWVKKCALFSAVQSTPPHDPHCLHSTHRARYFLEILSCLFYYHSTPGPFFCLN